jgi:hypothetical protein
MKGKSDVLRHATKFPKLTKLQIMSKMGRNDDLKIDLRNSICNKIPKPYLGKLQIEPNMGRNEYQNIDLRNAICNKTCQRDHTQGSLQNIISTIS